MKKYLRKLIQSIAASFSSTRLGGIVIEAINQGSMERTQSVKSRGVTLQFTAPNRINKFRAKSFASKEPETLDWIDQLPESGKRYGLGNLRDTIHFHSESQELFAHMIFNWFCDCTATETN